MNKILGLDLGTNSIGWAIVNSDYSIFNAGTRIFPNKNPSQNIERAKKGLIEDYKIEKLSEINC